MEASTSERACVEALRRAVQLEAVGLLPAPLSPDLARAVAELPNLKWLALGSCADDLDTAFGQPLPHVRGVHLLLSEGHASLEKLAWLAPNTLSVCVAADSESALAAADGLIWSAFLSRLASLQRVDLRWCGSPLLGELVPSFLLNAAASGIVSVGCDVLVEEDGHPQPERFAAVCRSAARLRLWSVGAVSAVVAASLGGNRALRELDLLGLEKEATRALRHDVVLVVPQLESLRVCTHRETWPELEQVLQGHDVFLRELTLKASSQYVRRRTGFRAVRSGARARARCALHRRRRGRGGRHILCAGAFGEPRFRGTHHSSSRGFWSPCVSLGRREGHVLSLGRAGFRVVPPHKAPL